MDRIGRIIEWAGRRATIEVGLGRECATGNCADCHATAEGKWVFTVPWTREPLIGQRVMVRERGGLFRLLHWAAFLLAFCVVLALAQWLSDAARTEGTLAQRATIVAGIVTGVFAWWGASRWTRRRPPFRVAPLEGDAPAVEGGGLVRKPFIDAGDIGRVDRGARDG